MPLSRHRLLALIALIGCLNGLSRPILLSLSEQNAFDALLHGFNLNLFVVIAIIVALRFIIGATGNHSLTMTDKAIILLCLMAFCVPSAMVSWIVLAAFALWYGWHYRRHSQIYAGFLVLFAVSAREPVVMILLKTFASSVLSLDALLAQTLANLAGFVSERSDNLITTQAGRSILILAPCSSVSNLSIIWLGWLVAARSLSHRWQQRDATVLLTLTVMVLALNWLRLAMLTLSQEVYHWLHGEAGKAAYELTLILLMFIIIRRMYAKEMLDYCNPTRQHRAVG